MYTCCAHLAYEHLFSEKTNLDASKKEKNIRLQKLNNMLDRNMVAMNLWKILKHVIRTLSPKMVKVAWDHKQPKFANNPDWPNINARQMCSDQF